MRASAGDVVLIRTERLPWILECPDARERLPTAPQQTPKTSHFAGPRTRHITCMQFLRHGAARAVSETEPVRPFLRHVFPFALALKRCRHHHRVWSELLE